MNNGEMVSLTLLLLASWGLWKHHKATKPRPLPPVDPAEGYVTKPVHGTDSRGVRVASWIEDDESWRVREATELCR